MKTCARCSNPFPCLSETGRCWCDGFPSLGLPREEWTECLCPACLAEALRLRGEPQTEGTPQ